MHLRHAVVSRQWDKHSIDFRTTFGLFTRRFYVVVLVDHNLRTLTRGQQKRQLLINSIMLSFFLIMCMLLGLLALYLIKSAWGMVEELIFYLLFLSFTFVQFRNGIF